MKFGVSLLILILAANMNIYSERIIFSTENDSEYRHSIDLCPMSPLFKIYAIHYCYKITPLNEVIIAPYYANIHYKDIGNTDALGFIVGYRRYLWKNLHIDYQLMPQWDHFYDSQANKTYQQAFDLWNEFRLGYSFDFDVCEIPAFINIQWPFGFALYSDPKGKPDSFKKKVDENPFFYQFPMFFVGCRF
jgi:hypothetical protein